MDSTTKSGKEGTVVVEVGLLTGEEVGVLTGTFIVGNGVGVGDVLDGTILDAIDETELRKLRKTEVFC